jgi:hypothetical protein
MEVGIRRIPSTHQLLAGFGRTGTFLSHFDPEGKTLRYSFFLI